KMPRSYDEETARVILCEKSSSCSSQLLSAPAFLSPARWSPIQRSSKRRFTSTKRRLDMRIRYCAPLAAAQWCQSQSAAIDGVNRENDRERTPPGGRRSH